MTDPVSPVLLLALLLAAALISHDDGENDGGSREGGDRGDAAIPETAWYEPHDCLRGL